MKIILFAIVLMGVMVGDIFGDAVMETIRNANRMAKLNINCRSALELYADNLENSTDDDMWALRMWDASSKAPVGLMSYNFGEMGNFDQCVTTKSVSENIEGKHCIGNIKFTNTSHNISKNDTSLQQEHFYWRKLISIAEAAPIGTPTWAICIPSNCSDDDVWNILSVMQDNGMGFESVSCQTMDDLNPQLTVAAIVSISILTVILFTMILSTCYDVYCCSKAKVPAHPSLIAWSVYTNCGKLFQMEKKHDKLSALNGMRCISIIWVIILHTRYNYSIGPVFNLKDFTDSAYFWFDILMQSNVAVDTFLLIGGVLVSYVFFKQKRYEKDFNIFKHYFHRYMRLTPSIVGALITYPLLNYLGSGPKWDFIENAIVRPCKTHWWSVLLYIQNYVNQDPEQMCFSPSWYLNVDMQLFMFSPLILLLLTKHPKSAIAALVTATLAVIFAGFYQAYAYHLPGIIYEDASAIRFGIYMKKFYFLTHFRAAPWLMGVILGYLLTKETITLVKIPMVLTTLAWIFSFVVMTICVFGAHTILRSPDDDRTGNAFFIALQKPAWSACVGWIIWACATNRGGVINSILSHQLFQFLNQFTYNIYLLHYLIIFILVFSQKAAFQYSVLNVVYSTCGIFMFSFGLAIIWVLAFEAPALVLERIILK